MSDLSRPLWQAAEAEIAKLREGMRSLRATHPELVDELDAIGSRATDAYIDTYATITCRTNGHVLTERVDNTVPRQCMRCNQYPTQDMPTEDKS